MGPADAVRLYVGCPGAELDDEEEGDGGTPTKRTLLLEAIADGDQSLFDVKICSMREAVRHTIYRSAGDGGGRKRGE